MKTVTIWDQEFNDLMKFGLTVTDLQEKYLRECLRHCFLLGKIEGSAEAFKIAKGEG